MELWRYGHAPWSDKLTHGLNGPVAIVARQDADGTLFLEKMGRKGRSRDGNNTVVVREKAVRNRAVLPKLHDCFRHGRSRGQASDPNKIGRASCRASAQRL